MTADRDFDKVRHRDYQANEHRWRMAHDFYRGGRHVLEPTRRVAQLMGGAFTVSPYSSDTGKVESRASTSAMPGYAPHPERSYLHKHPREAGEEFVSRCNQAIHFPVMRSITDIYADAVLRVGPDRRDEVSDPFWLMFHRDVDRCGTSIDAFIRRCVVLGLVMPRCQVVVDRPRFDTASVTLADQLERGDRPYCYPVKATDFVDWQLDSFCNLAWGVVREDRQVSRVPGQPQGVERNQYRAWHLDRWVLWAETNVTNGTGGEWREADGDRHSVGEVPIAIFSGGRSEGRQLSSDSIMADLVDIDRSVFNQSSLLLEQIYSQVYAQLCLPLPDGESLPDGIEVGVRRVLGFNGSSGTPVYLSPSADVIRVQWELILQSINMARQMANVSRGKAEFSKEERSKAALTVESADKHSAVAALAERVEEFDHDLHRIVAAWRGKTDYPRAEYDRTVSLKSLSEQIDDVLRLKELGLKQAALQMLTRPVFTRALRESGVQQSEITEVVDDLLEMTPEVTRDPVLEAQIATQ